MRNRYPVWTFVALAEALSCQQVVGEGELATGPAPSHSVALVRDDHELWRFHHDPAAPHWYFHPLGLPGTPALTVDSPGDHVWHHGLWFSWKYIDGVNYWENAPGADRPAGRTRYLELESEVAESGAARFRPEADFADQDAFLTLTGTGELMLLSGLSDGTVLWRSHTAVAEAF